MVVTAVDPNSDAARKGLQRGDIVLSANYSDVASIGRARSGGPRSAKAEGREAVLLRVQARAAGPPIYVPVRLR